MKKIYVVLFILIAIVIGDLSATADIIMPPEPKCMKAGRMVDCPDFIPNYNKDSDKDKNYKVEYYGIKSNQNKKVKKYKKTKKIKNNRYSMFFNSPAYADIIRPEKAKVIEPAYADIPDMSVVNENNQSTMLNENKTKLLLSVVLLVLIAIAAVSIKYKKRKNDVSTNI